MESSASAWPWIVLAGTIGIAVVVGGLVGPPSFLSGLDFKLLTKTSGVLPSPAWRWTGFGIVAVIIALTVLFWWTVKMMTDDYADRVQAAKREALPTNIETVAAETDRLSCAVEHFKNQGFREKSKFESVDGGELVLLSKFERDHNDIWRAEGALVTEDGKSTRFSVGVIYGDGVWVEGTAKKIRRRGLLRNVQLETVLKNPDLRELSDTNDYLLTLGLASNSEGEDAKKNWKLSLARAHNLGLAALRLGWMPEDRIWPQSIGYSKTLAETKTQERKQRPVVLIGVIANRAISVPDVTRGTMEIVPVDVVKLEDYSQPIEMPREPRRLRKDSKYLEWSDINVRSKEYEIRTLDAVLDSKGTSPECLD